MQNHVKFFVHIHKKIATARKENVRAWRWDVGPEACSSFWKVKGKKVVVPLNLSIVKYHNMMLYYKLVFIVFLNCFIINICHNNFCNNFSFNEMCILVFSICFILYLYFYYSEPFFDALKTLNSSIKKNV
jgi:hypothetical protein